MTAYTSPLASCSVYWMFSMSTWLLIRVPPTMNRTGARPLAHMEKRPTYHQGSVPAPGVSQG